jgi:hypothetical protein
MEDAEVELKKIRRRDAALQTDVERSKKAHTT